MVRFIGIILFLFLSSCTKEQSTGGTEIEVIGTKIEGKVTYSPNIDFDSCSALLIPINFTPGYDSESYIQICPIQNDGSYSLTEVSPGIYNIIIQDNARKVAAIRPVLVTELMSNLNLENLTLLKTGTLKVKIDTFNLIKDGFISLIGTHITHPVSKDLEEVTITNIPQGLYKELLIANDVQENSFFEVSVLGSTITQQPYKHKILYLVDSTKSDLSDTVVTKYFNEIFPNFIIKDINSFDTKTIDDYNCLVLSESIDSLSDYFAFKYCKAGLLVYSPALLDSLAMVAKDQQSIGTYLYSTSYITDTYHPIVKDYYHRHQENALNWLFESHPFKDTIEVTWALPTTTSRSIIMPGVGYEKTHLFTIEKNSILEDSLQFTNGNKAFITPLHKYNAYTDVSLAMHLYTLFWCAEIIPTF